MNISRLAGLHFYYLGPGSQLFLPLVTASARARNGICGKEFTTVPPRILTYSSNAGVISPRTSTSTLLRGVQTNGRQCSRRHGEVRMHRLPLQNLGCVDEMGAHFCAGPAYEKTFH